MSEEQQDRRTERNDEPMMDDTEGMDGQAVDPKRNPARNLSEADRRRGGERSAAQQTRNERGHFAGKSDVAKKRTK
ncbi:MAG: hypothetical protein ABMB14_15645 [Myxococcota bacterium]